MKSGSVLSILLTLLLSLSALAQTPASQILASPSQARDAKETKGTPENQAAALAVAGRWLELVDANNFGQSWEDAASLFQEALTKLQWADTVRHARSPLGKVLSRTFKSADYKTRLPGVPDGEYFLLQYDTSFERKKEAVETVTVMLDKDGKWKVAGYFIK